MNARQKLQLVRLNEWSARFAEQKASGLNVKDWCRQNNVTHDTYYYWKRLLKERFADQMMPEIVPIRFPLPSGRQTYPGPNLTSPVSAASAQETLLPESNSSTVASLTVNGVSVHLTSGVTEDFLCSLIKAVRDA